MSDSDEFRQQYRIGDTANGYVLTPEGWKPVPPTSQPTVPIATGNGTGANPQYQVGDVANGYVLTPQGWRPAGSQATAYGVGGSGQPTGPATPGGPGPVPAPSRKGLYIALAVAAVVILGVAAAGTYAWVSLRSNTVSAPTTPTTRSTPRTTGTPGTRSTPSQTPRPTTPTTAPTAQAFTYGQAGTLSRRGSTAAAEIKVDKPVPFDPVSDIDAPERGQLVYVPVTVTVKGKEPVSIGEFDFVAVLPDGQRLDSALVVDLPKGAPTWLDDHDLNPGETLTGSVVFDVPKDTKITIGYQPTTQVLGTWSD